MNRIVLVTGGCGFIASNFLAHMVEAHPEWLFVNADRLDPCGSLCNIQSVARNYRFRRVDLRHRESVEQLLQEFSFTHVMHFAAQTHVDNSFAAAEAFVADNVMATTVLLECLRSFPTLEKLVYVSTDEVLGDAHEQAVDEQAALHPTNPYAASKAAGELMALAYLRSFKVPVVVTRGNNVYGPRQYPEKVVPRFLLQAARGLPLTVHGSGEQRRSFLFFDDAVAAFETVLERGAVGETYNIGAPPEFELSVNELAARIGGGVAHVADRAYNDQHYRVNSDKLAKLGWRPRVGLDEGLARTRAWYASVVPEEHWNVLPPL